MYITARVVGRVTTERVRACARSLSARAVETLHGPQRRTAAVSVSKYSVCGRTLAIGIVSTAPFKAASNHHNSSRIDTGHKALCVVSVPVSFELKQQSRSKCE